MRRSLSMGAAAVLALVLGPAAVAAVYEIPAARDNTLFEDAQGELSNGSGEYFFAGTTASPFIRRGLIAFDVAASVPAGSTVTSVTLALNMSRTISGPETVSLHRLAADWGEGSSDAGGEEGIGAPSEPGDATWIHTFYPTDFWSAAGGDYSAVLSASTSVDSIGPYTWGSTADMVADVQDWLDNPGDNFGWILIGEESANGTAKRFDSRENAEPSVRPVLIVETAGGSEPVPATSAWGLFLMIAGLAAASAFALRGRAARSL